MPRPLAAVVLTAAGALLLAGCAPSVSLTPAADAGNPACADALVSIPDDIGGQQRRWTDAQATAAWGEPATIVLACGVQPPGPTEATCLTIAGIDWILDDTDAPTFRLTTYGREPAIDVLADTQVVDANTVLDALAPSVAAIPASRVCTPSGNALP